MSLSDRCSVVAPQTKPCGEFGTCFESAANVSFCLCKDGFTQFGDFSTLPDLPCDIYVTAIRALWALPALFALFGVWISGWAILSRLKAGPLQKSAWRLWSVPYFVIVSSIGSIAMSVGKFIDPQGWAIGISVGATVLHGFSVLILCTGLIVGLAGIARTAYLDSVRTLSHEDRGKLKFKMRAIEVCIALFWFSAAVCSFIPVAILEDPKAYHWAFSVQAIGLGFGIFILGVIVTPTELGIILRRVEESINANKNNKSATNKNMARVLLKLRIGRPLTFVASLCTAVLFMFFGIWDYMIPKSSYYLPLMYCIATSAGSGLIWVTTTTTALNFRRPSQALKRLSMALIPNGRRSRSRSSLGGDSSPTTALMSSPTPDF